MKQRNDSGADRRLGRVAMAALVALACMVVGTGCATQRHMRRGDQALARNDAATALHHYEEVLAREPERASDPEFVAKLNTARRNTLRIEGHTAANHGDWEAAMAAFAEALRVDPLHAPTQADLNATRRKASAALHADAVAAADNGDLEGARETLVRALRIVPGHEPNRQALASLRDPGTSAPATTLAAFEQGRSRAAARQWDRAREFFDQAIDGTPTFLPARAARHRALVALETSARFAREGQIQLRNKALTQAQQAFERALEQWPENPDANRDLARTKRFLDDVAAMVAAGRDLFRDGRWDQAIGCADQALGIFPDAPDAKRLREDSRDAAATAWVEEGTGHLERGAFGAAETAFSRAFDYRPGHRPAVGGLAATAEARGDQARDQGLAGYACRWYQEAAALTGDRALSRKEAAMLERVYEDAAWSVELTVRQPGGGETGLSMALEERLQEGLGQRLALVLRGPGAKPDETIHIVFGGLEITTERTRSETFQQAYEMETVVANPELPKLEAIVAVHQRQVRIQQQAFAEARRAFEKARAHLGPDAPVTTPRLASLQHEMQRAEQRWHEAERDLRRARARFDGAPATVIAVYEERWPYTVDSYTKEASLHMRIEWPRSYGDSGRPTRIDEGIAADDVVIDHPNATLGVPADPLILPSDGEMVEELLDTVVPEVINTLTDASVKAHVRALRQQADAARQHGDKAVARDLEIRAALVLGVTSPADSEIGLRRIDLRP